MSLRRRVSCLSMACAALLALTPGCATTPPGTGGSGNDEVALPRPPLLDTKASREEAARVAARVWNVAASVRDADAVLRFNFWSEQGALTLLSYVAENRGGRPAKPATDAESTQRQMAAKLVGELKPTGHEVALTLRRTGSSWRVDVFDYGPGSRPTGARTLPGRQGALSPEESGGDVAASVRAQLKSVQVPVDGTVSVDLSVRVRRGHMVGMEVKPAHVILSGRGDKTRAVSPDVAGEVAQLILLYAPCTGERAVHLGLRLAHRGDALVAIGGVEETRVDQALPSEEGEFVDFR